MRGGGQVYDLSDLRFFLKISYAQLSHANTVVYGWSLDEELFYRFVNYKPDPNINGA